MRAGTSPPEREKSRGFPLWEGSCFLSGAGLLYDSVLLQQIQACRSDSQLDKQCYPVVQNWNQHGGCEIADPVFFAERQI